LVTLYVALIVDESVRHLKGEVRSRDFTMCCCAIVAVLLLRRFAVNILIDLA
jgi:hypothetical protein